MMKRAIVPSCLLAMVLFVAAGDAQAQFRSQMGQSPTFGSRQVSSGNPSGLPGADYRGTAQSPRGAPSNFRNTAQSPRGQQTRPAPQQQTQPRRQAQNNPATLRDLRYGRQRKETKQIDPRDVYRQGQGGSDGGGGY